MPERCGSEHRWWEERGWGKPSDLHSVLYEPRFSLLSLTAIVSAFSPSPVATMCEVRNWDVRGKTNAAGLWLQAEVGRRNLHAWSQLIQ